MVVIKTRKMQTTWWRAQPFFIHSFSLLTDASTLCWSRSAPSSQSRTLCEKKSERGSPSTLCVFSWVSAHKPQHKCPAWYHDRPHCPRPGKSTFYSFSLPLSCSHNTCPLQLLSPGTAASRCIREKESTGGTGGGGQQLWIWKNNSCDSHIVIPTFVSCRVRQQVSAQRENGRAWASPATPLCLVFSNLIQPNQI